MSVIIRLQNLPWTANALDIRRFFSGLSIPDGGVHIVGGDKGDAFIAFSTDEDARRAMLMDNGRLGGNVVKLLLSSKTEMQNVIAVARGVPSSGPSGAPASQQQGFNAPLPQGGPPPPMNQPRYGPQGNPQGYPQGQGPAFGGQGIGGLQGGPGNIAGGPPDQRQGMAAQFSSQQQGMPPPINQQGRPGDRPMWDGHPTSNQSNMQMREGPIDYGRRDMPPPGEMDRGREIPPQGIVPQSGFERGVPSREVGSNAGYDNMGPINGSHQILDRPPQQGPPHDYRDDPREFRDRSYDYRQNSPARERERYENNHSFDNRRGEGRKRGYSINSSPFVFISHMPPNINYKDVRKFFSGLEIPRDGLKLINDRKGRRVGDAYVKFSTGHLADEALKLDGWPMGENIVHVEKASPEEFERAVDSFIPANSPERDMRNEGRINYDRSGSMNYNNHGTIDYERNAPERFEPPFKRKRSRSPSEVRKGDSRCVVVKNLPFKLDKRDLFKFFSGLKFAKGDTSVHIEEGPDGRPKGTALIEFFSDKNVIRALSYHRKSVLGGRQIEVISIPVDEYRSRIARSLKDKGGVKDQGFDKGSSRKIEPEKPIEGKNHKAIKSEPKKGEQKATDKSDERNKDSIGKDSKKKEENENKKEPLDAKKAAPPIEEKRYYCVELRGVPFTTNNQTIREFFTGLQIAQRGIHIVFKPDGNAAGPAFVEFISSDDCKKAIKRDKEYIGKRYIDVKPITKKEMLEELRQLQSKFSKNPQQSGAPGGPSVAQKVGRPGCVVGVQNMHFTTTLEDILDFFRGFHPIANSVKMRYNQDGVPTGDAMVAFHNREDAGRAARELNKGKMHNRIVSVYLA